MLLGVDTLHLGTSTLWGRDGSLVYLAPRELNPRRRDLASAALSEAP